MSKIYFNGADSAPAENPLAQFKTYSYYQVLVMCDSTATADAISTATSSDVWLHKSSSDGNPWDSKLGPWAPKTSSEGGKYCVLVHGATDAGIVIDKVSIKTVVAAAATTNDRSTSVNTEGTIELSEPKGVTFMDLIARCCVALGQDASMVVYVLKTFFIGYGDDDEVHTISTVAPVQFVVTDVSGSFSEGGGQYVMQISGISDGMSRLPQFDRMLKAPVLNGKTLEEVTNTMQKNIAASYERMYKCIEDQVKAQERDLGYKPNQLVNALRRVEYRIELDDHYKNPKGGYKILPRTQQTSPTGTCDGPPGPIVTGGDDFSIESSIHHIMAACQQVQADTKDGTLIPVTQSNGIELPAGTKISYKIRPTVKILKTSPGDKQPSHIITYRIAPYVEPTQAAKEGSEAFQTMRDKNTIHFEYLYTGQNIDILEFEIKFNQGLSYLQTATITNSYKSQADIYPGVITIPDVNNIADKQRRLQENIPSREDISVPVFFSTNLELPYNRSTATHTTQSSLSYTLSKHSSYETLAASVKITGNVTLLNSVTTKNPSPTDILWAEIPSYAKIHIMMPSNNDDIGLFAGDYSHMHGYATKFWFDGYYQILGIEHVFDNGEFIQNLSLVSMPDPLTDSATDRATKKRTSANIVASCYNTSSAAPSSSAASQTSNKPLDSDTKTITESPAAKHAATQKNPRFPVTPIDQTISTMSPENLPVWKNMDDRTKNAIVTESAKSNIPTSTYAAIASIESAGKASAVSTTNAKGLFQFTAGTWKEVMPNHPINPGAADPRFDPALNAQATRKYFERISKASGGSTDPTVLYMGHNMGIGAGPATLRAAEKNPDKPMAELYAEHGWDWKSFAKNNGYDINSTAGDMRNQVAGKFAKQLSSKDKQQLTEINKSNQSLPSTAAQSGTSATQAVTSQPVVKLQDSTGVATAAQRISNVTPFRKTSCGTTAGGESDNTKEGTGDDTKGNTKNKAPKTCHEEPTQAKTPTAPK